jgi:hypothetical protein
MISFRTSLEVKEDRRVVLELPPETPVGQADLLVTVSTPTNSATQAGSLRRQFGAVRSGDPGSADNSRIDADLVRSYGEPHEE